MFGAVLIIQYHLSLSHVQSSRSVLVPKKNLGAIARMILVAGTTYLLRSARDRRRWNALRSIPYDPEHAQYGYLLEYCSAVHLVEILKGILRKS